MIRLTAALQTMARRPPALALVQPGSLDEVVRVRSLLASTLPVIRARTADLRAEVERGDRLRRQADLAVAALVAGQRGTAPAPDRARRASSSEQRARSASLMESAMAESDRALAFGEEARELAARAGTRQFQDAAPAQPGRACPARVLRPARRRAPARGRARPARTYCCRSRAGWSPAWARFRDAGVHARGLTFATARRRRGGRSGARPDRLCRPLPRLWPDRHHRPWRRLDDRDHQSRRARRQGRRQGRDGRADRPRRRAASRR